MEPSWITCRRDGGEGHEAVGQDPKKNSSHREEPAKV